MLLVLSQLLRIFDLKGGIAATVIGGIIVFSTDIEWLALLLIFAFGSFIATKAWFAEKKEKEVQEGKTGERGYSNVVYGGILGCVIAVASLLATNFHLAKFPFFEIFAISIGVINSDTFASEIGIKDGRVRMITNFHLVKPGTNGGISIIGTSASIVGAVIIGLSFSLLAYDSIVIYKVLFVSVMAFFGNIVDSILGATLENRGYMSKGSVNMSSAAISVILSVIIVLA